MFGFNIYNIDLERFILEEIPSRLRDSFLFRDLYVYSKPLRNLYDQFLIFRNQSIYKITHTSQVGSMENVFNDRFDSIQRRIYITDGLEYDPLYLYRRIENKPVIISRRSENEPIYLFRRSEIQINDVDFIVVIPLALQLTAIDIIRLRALIDFYRNPDKTYTLKYE